MGDNYRTSASVGKPWYGRLFLEHMPTQVTCNCRWNKKETTARRPHTTKGTSTSGHLPTEMRSVCLLAVTLTVLVASNAAQDNEEQWTVSVGDER